MVKSFLKFLREDVQNSVATVSSVEAMESGELTGGEVPYSAYRFYKKKKKKKVNEAGFYELDKNNWSEHDHNLWKDKQHLRPAIKVNNSGKIHIGKPGDTHQDIDDRHKLAGHSTTQGMYHTKTKQFHSGSAIDSTDLMSPMQRMRKFGNEETSHEETIVEVLTLEEYLAEGVDRA